MANLIKITKDENYDYKWSIDGNKYGDTYDITSAGGFGDTNLVNQGWEEVLAVNGGLFYTYDSKHYACGLEKSRGTNNQELEMSCVTDYNPCMSIACVDNELYFASQEWIIKNKLDSAYGAITGMGLLLDGKAKTDMHKGFESQWNQVSGRTIIGEDKEGNFLSYSVKGATGTSGITGEQAVKVAQENGFHNAIMLDGGGSVWRRYFGAYDITTTRKVKNALILYRKKKDGVVSTSSDAPIFTERLSSTGIKGNKYWYDTNYNKGASSSGTMLPNCFAGETEFITKNGIKRFDEVAGQDVEVLGRDGSFYKAHVNKYEAQPLYKVTMCNGNEYYATENHRWITVSKSGNDVIKTTKELMSMNRAQFRYSKRYDLEDLKPELEGIYHGFIYGDGTYRKNLDKTVMLLCDYKKDFMLPLVNQDTKEHKIYNCANNVTEVGYFDKSYKQLPNIETCSDEYLLGFLSGYIAADGNVGSSGRIDIMSAKEESLIGLRDICARLGLRTSKVKMFVHDTNYKKNAVLYRLRISPGLPTKHYINTKQRQIVELGSLLHKERKLAVVKSVELTNKVEEVYCVDEPIHHEFTLSGGELTKNCTTYVVGRTCEIAGQACKIFPKRSAGGFPDAKGFYSESDWVGSAEPVVGGIICWGASTDKYGHVAICERVLGQTSTGWKILVSQSNYGGTFFETKEYTVKKGVKTNGVGYIYNGCLHNPYINDIRVSRDTAKNQVEVLVDKLKVRTSANGEELSGRFIAQGTYNVIEFKEAGSYTWAKLAADTWIATNDIEGWTKTYYIEKETPTTDSDLEKQIEELKAQLETANNNISSLRKEKEELTTKNSELVSQVNEAKEAEELAENKVSSYKEIIKAAKVILDRTV